MIKEPQSAPRGWSRKKLGAIIRIATGQVDPKQAPYSHMIHVGPDSIPLGGGRIVGHLRTASEQDLISGKYEFDASCILYSKIRPNLNKVAMPGFAGVCSADVYPVWPKDSSIDGRFLFQLLRSRLILQPAIAASGRTGLPKVNRSDLEAIEVAIPPIFDQRNIAEILSTWDLTLSLEETLCARLSSAYRAVADRFLQIRGEAMYRLGRLLTPEKMVAVTPEGPFRALGIRSHGKGTFSRIDALVAVEEFGKAVYRVEPNRFVVNIVFAWEGAAAITSEADAGCLVSHRFPTFRINEQLLDIEYFRHVIRTKPFQQLLALASPGGAGRNKTLNRTDLLKFEIHVPPLSKQKAASEALNSLDRRIFLLDRHIAGLTKQRDALASQLLTGRLRVPEAQGAADLGD